MAGEPTIEELQAKILEYQQKNEELETKLGVANKDLETTKTSLNQARELNTQYYHQMAFNNPEPTNIQSPEEPQTKETVEEFIDSFLKPVTNNMKKIYGDENVADFN